MAKPRYQIWDEVSRVITPSGRVFTPEEWMIEWPMAALPEIELVISGGTVNGGFCAVYDDFVDMYENMGCDFSACESKQDFLNAIEAFENKMNEPRVSDALTNEELTATSLASIAASLEYQNMLTLEDIDFEEEV